MSLKPYEMKLLSHLLQLACDQFSNHGCNDLDLSDPSIGMSEEDKKELITAMVLHNGDGVEIDDLAKRNSGDWDMAQDYAAMAYFAQRLKDESNI